MADIDALLIAARDNHASDLHLTTGSPPLLRIHGELKPIEQVGPIAAEVAQALIEQIMTPEQKQRWYEHHDVDFSYEIADAGRFRVNAFFQRQGPGAVFRHIPFEIKNLQQLGLPQQILQFANYRSGLVLVTGATGSGKSTTLAAIIDHINAKRHDHIITIEDPIEFVHPNKGCLVNQREAGVHTDSFATALRAALREDPDVILVGEMRDLETIELALTAAETGHLVFGTLHTNSAADTVDRIINVFPVNQQPQIRQVLSTALIGVVSQELLKRADGQGRIAAIELMLVNTAIANLIREGKTFQIPSMIQTAKKEGMQTLDQCLQTMVQEGKITKDEALQHAHQKDLFGGETAQQASQGVGNFSTYQIAK
ncbi:MAG: type IV pilus twitching motility protein PilT [Candidatus Omnitrophica bacterium]|nr:type IV pilus twitching motility protein PilT [Candidatus Omnitrophota bacterium]